MSKVLGVGGVAVYSAPGVISLSSLAPRRASVRARDREK